LDNASSENKNHYLQAYAHVLVEYGFFNEVYVSFLIPGHTHEDIDQLFGVVKRTLRFKVLNSIYDVSDLLTSHYINVQWVNYLWDWKSSLDTEMSIIEGIKLPLAFLIKRWDPPSELVAMKWKHFSATQLLEGWLGGEQDRKKAISIWKNNHPPGSNTLHM